MDFTANFRVSYNAYAADEDYFAVVATICIFRPELARRLLTFPLAPLVAGGIETGEQVIALIQYALKQEGKYTIATKVSKEGREWLDKDLPALLSIVDQVLAEEICKAEKIIQSNQEVSH